MLYLIRTFGRNNKTVLKVGFTDDNDARSLSYKIHNPLYETISTREGTMYDETKMHLYLTALNLKRNILNEWFKDCNETQQSFHSTINKINRTIWKNRNRLFSKSDFKNKGNNIKCKIYEELRMINNLNHPQQIDIDWKIESNKKILKSLKNNTNYLD